jgi:hypothetical protein
MTMKSRGGKVWLLILKNSLTNRLHLFLSTARFKLFLAIDNPNLATFSLFLMLKIRQFPSLTLIFLD